MSRFLISLSYLSIRNRAKKRFDWLYPLIGTAVVAPLFLLVDDWGVVFNKKGPLPQVSSFLGILVGFFVASLAAISSFSGPNGAMDAPTKGQPLEMTKLNG